MGDENTSGVFPTMLPHSGIGIHPHGGHVYQPFQPVSLSATPTRIPPGGGMVASWSDSGLLKPSTHGLFAASSPLPASSYAGPSLPDPPSGMRVRSAPLDPGG